MTLLLCSNGIYGVQTDANGLTYHRARYYHPGLRRFLNQDNLLGGIGTGASLNRFAYANGCPVSLIDPFGLLAQDVVTTGPSVGDYIRVEARKPGKTPPTLWPEPPESVLGSKPKWNPEGYWEGKGGRRITWDDRSHGTGQDRGNGVQGGHWDGENGGRWLPDGTPLRRDVAPPNAFDRWITSIPDSSIPTPLQAGLGAATAAGAVLAAPIVVPWLAANAGWAGPVIVGGTALAQ